MKRWIAFFGIVAKDVRAYYLKPPNISWGLLFPLAWTGMFFIRSGTGLEGVRELLPGVAALSILFGTTSMLAVTVTFEKRNRSFDRLLLAPISLQALMWSKTVGAIAFGTANAFVPVAMAAFLTNVGDVAWGVYSLSALLLAVVSAFLGFFIAVAVTEVFEAQTLSNFFRFPMLFLCGLFFPIAKLPVFLKPLAYLLPMTYGVDALHGAVNGANVLPVGLDLALLALACAGLFAACLWNVRRKWIM
jgi:ABC-2 type transport system permease protein